MLKQVIIVAALLLGAQQTRAQEAFRFSNTLGSNMVLQRKPHQAVVWGWSAPADTVTVYHVNWVSPFTADENGLWKAQLPSTPEGGPYTIKAESKHYNKEIDLENVLFGDVFICSGQSNMQFTLDSAFNASHEVAETSAYDQIRVFTVGQKTQSTVPLDELKTVEQNWSIASPTSIGGGNWTYFSAVCWLFGRDVYNSLEKQVPIGLISNNWGGTCVESWSGPDALAQCNQTAGDGYETFRSTEGKRTHHFRLAGEEELLGGPEAGDSSVRWNAMIHPYLPMRISGAIWYQGECNVGTRPQHGGEYYACQFPAMIDDWRTKFQLPDMYFGFVQLAPWIASKSNSTAVAELRQGQMAALKLQNVGMATAADKGDPFSPWGSVHPRDKQDVGFRLALTARALLYKQPAVQVYQGPICTGVNIVQAKLTADQVAVQVTLNFQPSTVGTAELFLKKNVTCPDAVPPASCSAFEFQSSHDMSWNAAEHVEMLGENIAVMGMVPGSAESAQHPISGVRYGFSDWPLLSIYNSVGLPAVPFNISVEA